jgi:hypothetical protein
MHNELCFLSGLIYAFLVILVLLSTIVVPAILLLFVLRYFNQCEINKLLSKKN